MPRTRARTPKRAPRDLYQEVTDAIAAALSQGVAPWTCPWKGGGSGVPLNGYTGTPYRGVNIFHLWAISHKRGYSSPEWYTFRQAKLACGYVWETNASRFVWMGDGKDPGFGVRKHETSSPVLYYESFTRGEDEDVDQDTGEVISENRREVIRIPRHYNVFNREQIEGLPAARVPDPHPAWESDPRAERFFRASGAPVRHGGGRAYYDRGTDQITMPERERFADGSHYYATLAHECAHWTHDKLTPPREVRGTFGSPTYAEEELIAELTAAFCCAHLGISGQLGHPEYIASWLTRLQNDKRFFFRAAREARRAADHLGARSDLEALAIAA